MTRQVFLCAVLGAPVSRSGAAVLSAARGAIPETGVEPGLMTGADSEGKAGGADTPLMKLTLGSETRLTGAEAHHASVKRLRAGEVVDLVNGQGWRAGAELVGTGADLRFRLVEAPHFEALPALRLTLIQALAKEKRDLQAVEAACEIGVQRVIPWGAARAVSRWDNASKREKGRTKWAALALSALKQSRQSWLARVEEYVESGTDCAGAVFTEVAKIVESGGQVFVLHESAVERLSVRLRAASRMAPHEAGGEADGAGNPDVARRGEAGVDPGAGNPDVREIAVVVGPEGGITEAELAGFRAAGAEIALLGSSVLRCSTAGPAALAIIQATLGSW